MSPVLEMRDIEKSYGAVRVLRNTSLSLEAGTITAIAGENGAGKSTFIKVLSGAESPSAGTVFIDDVPLAADPRSVIEAGVSVIYQELTDVADMSVAHNVMLGRQSNRWGVVNERENRWAATSALKRVGLESLDTRRLMRDLSLPTRQLAEIARCLARDARVLVLDEPTSSLPERDVETLLTILEALRQDGLAILYVSHHLDEVFRIADRIAVLRDGSLVDTRATSEWTQEALVKAMVGREVASVTVHSERPVGDPRLVVTGLRSTGVDGIDLSVCRSEIVGLVGLDGSGHQDLMRAVAGVQRVSSGAIAVDGVQVQPGSMKAARRAGLIYAPKDRKVDGLVLSASVDDNLSYGNYGKVSSWGILRRNKIRTLARESIQDFGIKVNSGRMSVGRLSGGNQQKVVLARVVQRNPSIAFLDDPTRGVDVGARAAIHERVFGLARSGAGVVVSSSDTDEVLSITDRIYIVRGGRVVATRTRDQYDREEILHLAAAA